MTEQCQKCNPPHDRWSDDDCPFVSCDKEECRALRDPKTPKQIHAAYEHWRYHGLDCGCSHGC